MGGFVLPLENEECAIRDSWLARDTDAFDQLYRRYSSPLKQYCHKRLFVAADVEDACQETMIKAQQALERFRPDGKLWPWLATIAANVCTDLNRARSKVVDRVKETDLVGDPEEEAEHNVRAEIVNEALLKLRRDYKISLYLREFDGWSHDELARFKGTTLDSVGSLLKRARQALRREVKIVAKARGQWPLPAVIPIPLFRQMLSRRSDGMFLRKIMRKLRGQPAMEVARLTATAAPMNALGGLLALLTTVGMVVGVTHAIDASRASETVVSSAVSPAASSHESSASSDASFEGVEVIVPNSGLADTPTLSTELGAGMARDGERATLNAKVNAYLEGTPGADLSDGTDYYFYCDADFVNATTCETADSLPSSP